MPGYGAVTRSTLRQQIADALRDEVLAGRLRPGVEFTVKQIAEQYGVSATPVREALFDLSAQGLLESDQHRGFRVREFSARRLPGDGRGARAGHRRGVPADLRRVPVRPAVTARTAPLCVSVRRRGEEAARAGAAATSTSSSATTCGSGGSSAPFANAYISDFLQRLRMQAWVFAVPYLRGAGEVRDWLWNGHQELVEAITAPEGPRRAVPDGHTPTGWTGRTGWPPTTPAPGPLPSAPLRRGLRFRPTRCARGPLARDDARSFRGL